MSAKRPSRLASLILGRISQNEERPSLLGDAEEMFHDLVRERGPWYAKSWYRSQALKSLPMLVTNRLAGGYAMFNNYIKIAVRNILKHKGYSFINIAGLAAGMASCLLILLFIQSELGYDRFHTKAERIFRIVLSTSDNGIPTNANGSFGVGPALKKGFPSVLEYACIRRMGQGQKVFIGRDDKKFFEDRFFFATPSLLTIFDFPLLRGNPATALAQPGAIVLTEDAAKKYFGAEDPIGKTLIADPYNDGRPVSFQVTGIARNVPRNSHVRFDFLASFQNQRENLNGWNGPGPNYTYVLLDQKSSAAKMEPQLSTFLERVWMKDPWYKIHLQPLLDIRLRSGLKSEIEPAGDISYVYIFSAIGLFLLGVAGVNYLNLATARSARRAKEVGLRKTVGARRGQLVGQFLGESMVLCFGAGGVAFALAAAALPFFNRLADKDISLRALGNPLILAGLLLMVLVMGLLSGTYPALFLSAFKPASTLKGKITARSSGAILRKGLVTFQFSISVLLIAATLLTVQQMEFIRSKDPGFIKEGIMVVSLNGDARANYEALKGEWLGNPGILGVTTSSHVPTRGSNHEPVKFDGNDELQTQVMYEIDMDFVSTYGLQLTAGTAIRRPASPDSSNEFIISEQSMREIGYASPREAIGKTVETQNMKGFIAGVVKDMNIYSLHREPYPILYLVTPIQNHNFLSLRLRADGLPRTIEAVGRIWKKIVPGYPLDYFFMDESFQAMHRADQNLSRVVSCFAVLTIFVACLGLFALAAFTSEQKTKEIGIRKVLGARSSHIYFLLSKEFIRWVALANAIALPAGLWLMHQWLRNFAYRTSISPWLLIRVTLISLAIAQLTISYQSLRSARSAPINAIKYE